MCCDIPTTCENCVRVRNSGRIHSRKDSPEKSYENPSRGLEIFVSLHTHRLNGGESKYSSNLFCKNLLWFTQHPTNFWPCCVVKENSIVYCDNSQSKPLIVGKLKLLPLHNSLWNLPWNFCNVLNFSQCTAVAIHVDPNFYNALPVIQFLWPITKQLRNW